MRKQIILVFNAESRALFLIPINLPLLTGRSESTGTVSFKVLQNSLFVRTEQDEDTAFRFSLPAIAQA